MNASATSVGGWPATTLKKYLDEAHRLNKKSGETNFIPENHKLYLLSPHEISSDKMANDTAYDVTRQLDYYANNKFK